MTRLQILHTVSQFWLLFFCFGIDLVSILEALGHPFVVQRLRRAPFCGPEAATSVAFTYPLASFWPCLGTSCDNFGHLGAPRHLLGWFLTKFHRFFMNFMQIFIDCPWILHRFFCNFCIRFSYFFQILLQFSTVLPIPPSISKASKPPGLQASKPSSL